MCEGTVAVPHLLVQLRCGAEATDRRRMEMERRDEEGRGEQEVRKGEPGAKGRRIWTDNLNFLIILHIVSKCFVSNELALFFIICIRLLDFVIFNDIFKRKKLKIF